VQRSFRRYDESWEAIGESLAVLVRSMFGEGRGTGGLQERGLAGDALDIHSLLVGLELRLCDFGVLVLAITLGGCLGSVSHLCGIFCIFAEDAQMYTIYCICWLGRLAGEGF